jgi:hypothetical protein
VTLTNSATGATTTQSQATSGTWSLTLSNLGPGVYVVSARGFDMVGNTAEAPPRRVVVSGSGQATLLRADFQGSAGQSYGTTWLNYPLTFTIGGAYKGVPVHHSYYCMGGSCWQPFDQGLLALDLPGDLPAQFSLTNVKFDLQPIWVPGVYFTPVSGTFTLTATIFDNLELSCSGLADPGPVGNALSYLLQGPPPGGGIDWVLYAEPYLCSIG